MPSSAPASRSTAPGTTRHAPRRSTSSASVRSGHRPRTTFRGHGGATSPGVSLGASLGASLGSPDAHTLLWDALRCAVGQRHAEAGAGSFVGALDQRAVLRRNEMDGMRLVWCENGLAPVAGAILPLDDGDLAGLRSDRAALGPRAHVR